MAINNYLNVPEEIADKIESREEISSLINYRFLYQRGNPLPSDFIPTFMDEKQKEIREKRSLCGGMAKAVVSQHRKVKIGEYSVSLFIDLTKGKDQLWKNDSYKKDYPAIAVGPTNKQKGYAVQNNDYHISYFLFDYISNNPYNEFTIIEEAVFDE